MSWDANTIFGPVLITTTAYVGTGVNTGDGMSVDGQNLHVIVTNMIGNCNLLIRVSCSPDNVNWFPCASDPLGPINTPGERNIHFSMRPGCSWYRVEAYPNETPDGLGSKNSSSLSSQAFNSSSSGGTQACTLFGGLTVSSNG